MPQGHDYIFAIQDKDFKFWSLDVDGNVVEPSTTPYLMDFSPVGWNDIALQNIRNKVYKSIDRTVSLPLGYVKDAAKIFKYIVYKYGFHRTAFLVIGSQQLDYDSAPLGSIVSSTGSNPFLSGTNTGQIIGEPNTTVYIQVSLSGGANPDSIFGNIGGGVLVNMQSGDSAVVYSIAIPSTGYVDYNLFFSNPGGLSVGQLLVTTSLGSTTGSYLYWYKQIFRGEIDFTTFDHKGPKVTCSVIEDGLPKYLKANDKTVYEFPFDDLYVKMTGIKLHEKLRYVVLDGISIRAGGNGTMLPMLLLGNDGDHTGIQVESEKFREVGLSSNVFTEALENYCLLNTGLTPIDIRISGIAHLICTNKVSSNCNMLWRIGIVNVNGTTISNNEWLPQSPNFNVGQTVTHNYDLLFTIPPNCILFFFNFYSLIGTSYEFQFEPGSEMSITFKTQHPNSYIRAVRPQSLFEKLIEKVTEGAYTASQSAYLISNKTKVLTSGNGIRGLEDATIKISLANFFKAWDSIDSVGLVDYKSTSKVDLAKEIDLVDITTAVELPSPGADTFNVIVDKEELINELTIGFPEIRNDVGVVNGNEEFNSATTWSTETTIVSGKLEKISPVRAASYEIEKIRITTFEKKTTDNKNDNETYWLHITDTLIPSAGIVPEHYELDRTLNQFVTDGLLEPETIFNLWFTPARSLARMGNYIRGLFYKSDWLNLNFRSAFKNNKLICDGVVEKANVNIGSLAYPIGFPILFNFEVPVSESIIPAIENNPLQVYKFLFEGVEYYGILEKISISTSSNKSQSVVMRSVAINDLTNLNDYDG